ncbi:hypothetical protein MKY96_33395 [Paenibacillus sp. FSL R7-0302]|uniref:hypothetical protein n=1 Tax=Paenibacillus sp. FSL R7-0302 TaxID=2921681 RepID=UPI0030F65E8E
MSIKDRMKNVDNGRRTRSQQARDALVNGDSVNNPDVSPGVENGPNLTPEQLNPDGGSTTPPIPPEGGKSTQNRSTRKVRDGAGGDTAKNKEKDVSGTKKNASPKKPKETPEAQDQTPVLAYVPKRRKQARLKDTHTSQAYNIQNEILELINEVAGDGWGDKYRIVNDALKMYFHQLYPELAKRIKEYD